MRSSAQRGFTFVQHSLAEAVKTLYEQFRSSASRLSAARAQRRARNAQLCEIAAMTEHDLRDLGLLRESLHAEVTCHHRPTAAPQRWLGG